jgi:hypothetical protein
MITRRDALLHALFGAGLVGLRSFASGIPAAILLNPRRALAAGDAGAGSAKPQFVIFSTSFKGDPVNCNAPGTYDDPNIEHPNHPTMIATPMTVGGRSVKAAQTWSTLPASLLARTCFFHHATYTIIHPDEGKVLRMMGATAGGEMLPSILSRELSVALGTVRAQPISLGGEAIEAVYYQGAPQPLLTPTTLASVLSAPKNGLGAAELVKLRDQTLDQLNAIAKSHGNTAQKAVIDRYATSTTQLRTLQQGVLSSLSVLKNNSPASQIQAAIILFQMKVTPVVVVHVDFGGDNHGDPGLATEIAGHQAGIATLAGLEQALVAAGAADRVTFAMSNVFGRTMVAGKNADGRQHLATHHVTMMSGPNIRSSVIGGVAKPASADDYTALAIDSKTGLGSPSGDIAYKDTFASMGKTLAAAVGLSPSAIDASILTGSVVKAALA